jgi:CMP/dCMP kinase
MRQGITRGPHYATKVVCEKLEGSITPVRRGPVLQLSRHRDPSTGPFRHGLMIITVSGPHGTGKSTYAARLARALRIRHVSAGVLFRKIAKEKNLSLEELGKLALRDASIDRLVDERTIREAKAGDVVVDGQLAGWMLRERADLRIYLTAPESVRLERIAVRDRVSLRVARSQTRQRETVQRERYLHHYGFQVDDVSIYQLVLDTSLGSIRDIEKVLIDTSLMVRKTAKNRVKATKP